MRKYLYAYGHNLNFSLNEKKTNLNTIYINQSNTLPINDYKYKIYFYTNQDRNIYLKTQDDFEIAKTYDKWIFVVEGVVSFLCDIKTNQILFQKDYNYQKKLMEYWLIHIVLPIYFSLDNTYYFLHAGSVNVDDKAILFAGNSQAGKSTLTDYFLKKQHALLSDDKLATFKIDDDFYCILSHAYHRPYRLNEDLGIKADNIYDGKLKLKTIYWIEPVKANDDIEIQEIKGLKKFELLRYSTEMDLYVNQEKRFEYITKLANACNLYEIRIPKSLDRLEEVYKKIMQHTRNKG